MASCSTRSRRCPASSPPPCRRCSSAGGPCRSRFRASLRRLHPTAPARLQHRQPRLLRTLGVPDHTRPRVHHGGSRRRSARRHRERTIRQTAFSEVDPLTQRVIVPKIAFGAGQPTSLIEWQIVGVHADIRNAGLEHDSLPAIFLPFRQSPWPRTSMAVRTAGNPAISASRLRRSSGQSTRICRWATSRR